MEEVTSQLNDVSPHSGWEAPDSGAPSGGARTVDYWALPMMKNGEVHERDIVMRISLLRLEDPFRCRDARVDGVRGRVLLIRDSFPGGRGGCADQGGLSSGFCRTC